MVGYNKPLITKDKESFIDRFISSFAYPLIDVATICDATNFNIFDDF